MSGSKSPIKEKPLRSAGQSSLEQRTKLFEDKVESWALLAAFFVAFAAFEWVRYFLRLPPTPWLMSAVAVGFIAFAVWRYLKQRPHMKALRLGSEGERAVGEYLDRLREKGYRVFHDVLAEGFNIDHVLVGPAGVYSIETKTRSKPMRGDVRVRFDGEVLTVAGFEPERDAIVQAKAQARWLSALIADTTERRLFVKPVVLFPGWFVEAAPGSQAQAWVLEPKALPTYLDNEPLRLSKDEIALVAKSISMHVRAFQREREARSGWL